MQRPVVAFFPTCSNGVPSYYQPINAVFTLPPRSAFEGGSRLFSARGMSRLIFAAPT
ncbi:MAG: hypothetical protein AAF436_01510 [Myxococcota bacterium]